jgi:NADH-quinone oxidoreductase subunit L
MGSNAIEHFLEPSFTASHEAAGASTEPVGVGATAAPAEDAAQEAAPPGGGAAEEHEMSHAGELLLMLFSVIVAVGGIAAAYHLYVRRPSLSSALAERFAGPHRLLSNKYYVDELYDATVVKGTVGSARGLWTFDARVVDGAVNGSGWLTLVSSWISHLFDKYVVDGLVNLVGAVTEESSFAFRRWQTGLIQNYAFVMLLGVFAFVSFYLFVR